MQRPRIAIEVGVATGGMARAIYSACLLYTSDAADE